MEAGRVDRGAAGPGGQLGQGLVVEDREHRVADVEHRVAERAGRLVGAGARLVVAERHAAERRQRAVEQPDDATDRDGRRVRRDRVAAVSPERRPDDAGVLERRHDLLEELDREPVAVGERRQGDRAVVAVTDEIGQRAEAVLGATGQAHRSILPPKP